MYNRYIPNGTAYTRVVMDDSPISGADGRPPASEEAGGGPRPGPHGPENQPPPPLWGAASDGRKPNWLSGLLKQFKLEDLDAGDILLLLIILFLLIDGDDLELVITLGLLLLFGLGGAGKDD